MPKRLSTEQIRQRFAQYGFTVVDPNFQYRNNKQQIRVRDDISNTERNITMNNFSALIRRGRLAEVDPQYGKKHYNEQFFRIDQKRKACRSGPIPACIESNRNIDTSRNDK